MLNDKKKALDSVASTAQSMQFDSGGRLPNASAAILLPSPYQRSLYRPLIRRLCVHSIMIPSSAQATPEKFSCLHLISSVDATTASGPSLFAWRLPRRNASHCHLPAGLTGRGKN